MKTNESEFATTMIIAYIQKKWSLNHKPGWCDVFSFAFLKCSYRRRTCCKRDRVLRDIKKYGVFRGQLSQHTADVVFSYLTIANLALFAVVGSFRHDREGSIACLQKRGDF